MVPLPIHYAELETVYAATLGSGLRSLAVAAAESGAGVSTLAFALARRSAAAGRKTLLVDLNMSRPGIASWLGLSGADWRVDDVSMIEAIQAPPGLDISILPAPSSVAGAWGFREKTALQKGFERWGEIFECIVVDTSPLNRLNQGNIPPDRVCAACQGTLFVAQPGLTSEGNALEARDRLTAAGADLVGCVLNDRRMPSLADELCRETRRLERWCPKLMERVRARIRNAALLNQEI